MQWPFTHRSSPSGQSALCSVFASTFCAFKFEYLYSASESLVIMISLLSRKLAAKKESFIRLPRGQLGDNSPKLLDKGTVMPEASPWNSSSSSALLGSLEFVSFLLVKMVMELFGDARVLLKFVLLSAELRRSSPDTIRYGLESIPRQ